MILRLVDAAFDLLGYEPRLPRCVVNQNDSALANLPGNPDDVHNLEVKGRGRLGRHLELLSQAGYRHLAMASADWRAPLDEEGVEQTLLDAERAGLLRDGVRDALWELVRQLRFEQARRNSRVRELFLAEMFKDIEKIAIPMGAVNEETGHANHTDTLFVCVMARHLQAKRIFEFGTYMGRTTYHLTLASEATKVTTLNLPPEADPRYAPYLQSYFKGTDRASRIHQIFCDSNEFDTTPYRKSMDFIFVDADHSYDAVKRDTAKALEMLAPGGTIAWHDYAPKSPGVYTFMEEFTRTRPVFRIRNTCVLVYTDGVDAMQFKPLPMRPSLERAFHASKAA